MEAKVAAFQLDQVKSTSKASGSSVAYKSLNYGIIMPTIYELCSLVFT